MIFKSSQASREAWCRFLLALDQYHITDQSGNVLNKRQLFERYYFDLPGVNTELELIISGMHSQYLLIDRTDQGMPQDEVSDVIRDYLRGRAIVLARGMNVARRFDTTVAAMIEAMYDVLENYHEINRSIKEKALGESRGLR